MANLFILSIQKLVAQDDDDIYLLSPFLVTTEEDHGYGTSSSLGASRVALSNSDIASSIITINEQLFQDTAAVDAQEILTYVSGIQITSDKNPGQTSYSLRGYSLGGIGYRDGLPDQFQSADIPIDESTAYERIEVIKGPAGTLYGSHSMGGIVNKVSKWPLSTDFTNVEFQAAGGYEEFFRGVVDTNQTIGEKSEVRAVVSYRVGDRHYDEDDAPSDLMNITVMGQHRFANNGGRIWSRFQLLQYELDREQGWQYLTGYLADGASQPVMTDPVYAIGKSANIIPEDDISKGNMRSYEFGYEQPFYMFNGDWSLRLVARYNLGKGDKSPSYSQGRPYAIDADGNTLGDNRFVSANDPEVADWLASLTLRDFRGFKKQGGVYLDMVGKFKTWGLVHDMVINAQMGMSESERAFFFWTAGEFSAVNPDFTGVDASSIIASNETNFNPYQGFNRSESFSAGFQDNIGLMNEKLIFTVGARYDYGRGEGIAFDKEESIAQYQFVRDLTTASISKGEDTTYKVGAVYKPMKGLSLFGQIGTTFNFVDALDPLTSKKFPNQEGEVKEIGIKTSLFENRLIITTSYFNMELTNVLIGVDLPASEGGGTIQQAIGKQATEGIEMDIAWQPIDNLVLVLAFSDIESTDPSGNFFRGVPMDANYSIYGKYTFNEGPMSGFYTGLGYRHNAKSPGDTSNSYFLAEIDFTDVFAGYQAEKWSIQINVYNLFGADGIVSSVHDRLAIRAQDTNFRMTARYRF